MSVTDTVRVNDTVMLRVKGNVLGIGLRVTVIEVEGVGSFEGGMVVAGVADRVMLIEMV